MRLVSLSANQPSFRTLRFNREGLSLIVAEQRTKSEERTETYNGVGKTLSFALIHYCLGSNKVPAFETHLNSWEFELKIEVDSEKHVITRSAAHSSAITLDGDKIKLSDLRSFLESAAFDVNPGVPGVTFRSVAPRFLRFGRGAYDEFFFANRDEVKKPYTAMLRSAFLLGLDLDLAQRKYQLRMREQKLKSTMKQLYEDPLFRELLEGDTVDIELLALKEEVRALEEDLRTFRVAENYHAIEQEANRIKRRLDSSRREEVKIEEALLQIERSMQTRGDLAPEQVYQIYDEIARALPDLIQERVEAVLRFQHDLQQKRLARLSSERQRLDRRLGFVKKEIAAMSSRLDQQLSFLSEHRALDEYMAVNQQLSERQRRASRLEETRALRETVDRELKRIDLDLASENIRTDTYIEQSKLIIEEAVRTFRTFARELYGARQSGLTIRNDSGDNQLRYKIDAHISADAAEGINEAKIFCFDMTILALQRGHRFQFLGHDSTLFGPIDPRQRLAMFRIADRISRVRGFQYVAALNLHDISSIQQQVPIEEGEYRRLFEGQSVVLRLSDDSPAGKLLGEAIDMNYHSSAA